MKKLIISQGKYKGHKISCPPGEIRPVMNVVREAIFQILEIKYAYTFDESIRFLDLFSGSGLMSIEAISRNIGTAYAVESDKKKWSTIYKNISLTPKQIILIKNPVERFILQNKKPFDIIFVDPPFNYAYKEDLLKKLVLSKTITTHSMIIIHVPHKEVLHKNYHNFVISDNRKFGGSSVYFFVNENTLTQ